MDNVAAADRVDRVAAQFAAVSAEGHESHAVGVEGKEHRGFPQDCGRSCLLKLSEDSHICHVALSGACEGTEKGHGKGCGLRIAGSELLRGFERPHSVGTGGAVAYLVELFYGFHL